MAYTTPSTFVAGAVLTAAQLNTNLRDNIKFLARPPSVRVRTTANTTTANNTIRTVPFSSEAFDTDTMWSSTDSDAIYFRTAGKYLVGANVRFAASSGGTFRQFVLRLNTGTDVLSVRHSADMENSAIDLAGSAVYQFSSTQTLALNVLQNSGAGLNVEQSAAFVTSMWAIWQSS